MEDDAASDSSNQPPVEVRDQVMVKLGETIQRMKESFIVAYLNWKDTQPEHMEVPKEIQEHRGKIRKEMESVSPEGESNGSTQHMTGLFGGAEFGSNIVDDLDAPFSLVLRFFWYGFATWMRDD